MPKEARPRVLHVSVADRTRAHLNEEDRPDRTRTKEPSSPTPRRTMLAGMEITPRRRRAFATVLAVVLAIESVSAVAAAGLATNARLATAPDGAAPAGLAPSEPSAGGTGHSPARRASTASALWSIATQSPVGRRAPRIATVAAVAPAPAHQKTHKKPASDSGHAAAPIRHKGAASSAPARPSRIGAVVAFKGRNHVWIPALGVNRSISSFACSRSREPDNYVYRWGCAGSNNVYLLGHAWGVFKPLHDAYTSGRLRVGMKVWYADASGRVTVYAVRWWKVVKPTTAASWAWAAQATPSMTLQTCVGAQSQNRLMVRLTKAG